MVVVSLIIVFLGVIYHGGLAVVMACEMTPRDPLRDPDFWMHIGYAIAFFVVGCYMLTLLDSKC